MLYVRNLFISIGLVKTYVWELHVDAILCGVVMNSLASYWILVYRLAMQTEIMFLLFLGSRNTDDPRWRSDI